ncbi:uncharacterized protein LOC142165191 [Nicotiana tabacum]|uniref:Uncharacterized protein LOC142165191 n=1 Tax=Nicotiana tabacum TaxID=4097 RepID=A0AC58S4J8_TOBAC
MVLKDWDPNFQMQNESMRIVPIWINLPGLPIQCWVEENLGRIASLLGKPICTDRLTAKCERVSYARILVEMDITQLFPDEVCVEIPDRSWMQRVEFKWKPKFCLDCNKFGHGTGKCQQATQQEEEPMKHKRRRKKRTKIGKHAVVIQGAAGKTKHREINYEELDRRNVFAPLTILESPFTEGQQGQPPSTIAGQTANEDMIACLETRVKKHRSQNICRKMGVDWQCKDNYDYAPNGRLWLLWKEANVHVTVLGRTEQLIHCLVKDKNSSFTSCITFVYGLYTVQHRFPL